MKSIQLRGCNKPGQTHREQPYTPAKHVFLVGSYRRGRAFEGPGLRFELDGYRLHPCRGSSRSAHRKASTWQERISRRYPRSLLRKSARRRLLDPPLQRVLDNPKLFLRAHEHLRPSRDRSVHGSVRIVEGGARKHHPATGHVVGVLDWNDDSVLRARASWNIYDLICVLNCRVSCDRRS